MSQPLCWRLAALQMDWLRGWNLPSVVVVSLLVVAQASRTMDYRAKAPAEYDNSMFYEDDGEPARETTQDEVPNVDYPDIKYKAIQAKQSTDADYDFTSMHVEPIRPKRQKMGRTKLQPPTKKPAQFKVKPEVLMAKYLHESSEPIENAEVGGPARQRPGRWESKKYPQKQSEDDYDYTAAKLHGEKSPEEIYDHHKDDYDDEYDRRSYDPRNDHLKFILQPSPKKASRISVPTLTPSRWTLTRSTMRSTTVRTTTHSTVGAPTHSTIQKTTSFGIQATDPDKNSSPAVPSSLTVIPLKPLSEVGYDETENLTTQLVEVKQDGYEDEQTKVIQVQVDEPSKEVIPLDGLPFGPTKPPVFARMRPMDEGLPTMVLPNSERPDSLMVAEGMRHGPEVESARYKIRNHLLSRGIDPDSDPDEIICEYVEIDASLASIIRPHSACLFLSGLVSSTWTLDLVNWLFFIL